MSEIKEVLCSISGPSEEDQRIIDQERADGIREAFWQETVKRAIEEGLDSFRKHVQGAYASGFVDGDNN